MGFRNLALFNDSLLAKQAWRLLNEKTSLFYKVFKARFFLSSSIMEAADSRLGSYAWKSILKGRDVLLQGARWRIGSGENINIWQHNWLSKKHPPQLPICPIEAFANSTMDTLIDPNTRQWITELVDGLFVPGDAAMIKNISLSQTRADDVLF